MADLFPEQPAIVRPAPTARDELHRKHDKFVRSGKERLEHAQAIGAMLCEEKKRLTHGNWLPWVKENCPFDRERAAEFMRVWTERAKCAGARTFEEALDMIRDGKPKKSKAKTKADQEQEEEADDEEETEEEEQEDEEEEEKQEQQQEQQQKKKSPPTLWVKFEQKIGPLNRVIDEIGIAHRRSPEFLQMKEHLDAILVLKANWHRRLGEIG